MNEPNTTPSAQAVPGASSDPAPVIPAAPASDAPAFDVKAFEQSLQQFGPDWNLANWQEKFSKTRSELGSKGQKLTEIERRYNELENEVGPFRAAMRETPGFREYMGQAVQGFYEQHAQNPTMQGYAPQYAPQAAPLAGFDPVVQRLTALENEQRLSRAMGEMNDLASKGFTMNEEIANEVISDVQRSGMSFRDAYMVRFGMQEMQRREQEAAKAAVAALQKNNESYTPGPARSAPATAPSVDFSKMTPEQFEVYAKQQAANIVGKIGGDSYYIG